MLAIIEVEKMKQKEMNILEVIGGVFCVLCAFWAILESIVTNPIASGIGILAMFGFIYFVNIWIQFLLIVAFIIWSVQKDECFWLPEIVIFMMFYAMISILYFLTC